MKNKIFAICICISFLLSCTHRDDPKELVKYDKDSLPEYLLLANDYSLTFEHKRNFNQKAFDIIVEHPNDSIGRINLFKVANRFYNMGSWPDYKTTVSTIVHKSREIKDSASLAKAFTYFGDYYVAQSKSDSAFYFYLQAEKIFRKRNDNFNLAKTFLNKATLQYEISDYVGSEISTFNALRALKDEKSITVLFDSYNLLGALYNDLGDYNKALEFHKKAFSVINTNFIPEEFQPKATSYNNLGYVFLSLKDYKKAEFYFNEALGQKKLKQQKTGLYAIVLDNLGYAKFKMKDTSGLPKLFYKSLKIRDSLQLTAGIIASKLHLSEYYIANNDKAKGLQYLKEALATAKTSGNARNVLVALKQLSVLEPQKASVYSKSYIRINDSLQKAERKMGDKFTRIEYETDQVINENQALSMQNRTLFYVFSILCLIGLFFYSYKSQHIKHRELIFRQQQQLANEDIYNLMIQQQNQIEGIRINEKKRVAQELHDGVLSRMFGLRMSLDSINQINDDDASKKRTVYLDELKNIEQDIREISHDLSKEKSELINNFVTILDKLLEDQKRNFETCLTVAIDRAIKWENIENAKKINIYRIIQEALQNSNKYAKAQKIDIVLKKQKNTLVLTIIDDGIGFNIRQSKKGIGLQNIKYRIKECNGKFEINSDTNGTVITIIFPMKPNKHNLKNYDV
ncbi:tetratricopeptide repeat-containing sensor histidine kinase [Flavobacterium sp. TAB 87]|uniref:tetratricopeptide repeat-containing sensor histidine kinase n=1 Tax=Flavobacterium sp. TAB 87 TaxID=1729581 RepID=UPI00076C2A66|nr:tetratricopeptide repeat-containing sensor histidine kinase [Flavobacterium sp. TAB 87]KVV13319.1 Sensor histidine kinase LiaS [Flavobacterium sp. TAB 87]